jgi:amidase
MTTAASPTPRNAPVHLLTCTKYNDIKAYLAELENTNIRSLEDIMQYNIDNLGTEGGYPGIHPAFGSGQDGFDAALESKGIMDDVYYSALEFTQRTSREEGIDGALAAIPANHPSGKTKLDALLVPPDVSLPTLPTPSLLIFARLDNLTP